SCFGMFTTVRNKSLEHCCPRSPADCLGMERHVKGATGNIFVHVVELVAPDLFHMSRPEQPKERRITVVKLEIVKVIHDIAKGQLDEIDLLAIDVRPVKANYVAQATPSWKKLADKARVVLKSFFKHNSEVFSSAVSHRPAHPTRSLAS